MNRKDTPYDQNDTSLIFANLPKRLQMKIAEKCHNAFEEEDSENVVSTKKTTYDVGATASPRNSKPMSDNHVERQLGEKQSVVPNAGDKKRTLGNRDTDDKMDEIVIPGILRLNVSGAEQLKKLNNPPKSEKLNQPRRRYRAHHSNQSKTMAMHHEKSEISPTHVRLTTAHPVWFDHVSEVNDFHEFIQLYEQLTTLLKRNLLLSNWDNFCDLHAKLQGFFKQFLHYHLRTVCEHKIDVFFWKLLLYNIRENLKCQKSEYQMYNRLLALIDQSLQFYEKVYNIFTEKYLISATEFTTSKNAFFAKVVAQRLLICLGDLCRYRAKHLETNDFIDAIKFYQQAQQMIPTNGVPYNQLAIVAIQSRKKFDAVYYYMRSLLSSNSINTAKESLLDLFDDIRKKYEETEQKDSPAHRNNSERSSKQMRKEVWIYPDGVRRLHRTDVESKASISEGNRYNEMSNDDLVRRFSSIYLYLIGKLYTGIGMESIYQNMRKLFLLFEAVLKHNNLIPRSKFLKIVALNIFIMEHNMVKDSRREMRYHAFNFCNLMLGLLLRKSNQLLSVATTDSRGIDYLNDVEFTELNTALQFIKIYLQWFNQNVHIWEPIRCEDHSFLNCWLELQQLFKHIGCILYKQTPVSRQTLFLDEDIYLLGFAPLGRSSLNIGNYNEPAATEMTKFEQRIMKIAEYQKIYENNQHTLQMAFDSNFVPEELNSAMQSVLNSIETDEPIVVEDPKVVDNDDNCENVNVNGTIDQQKKNMHADITRLTKLKKELEEKTQVKRMYNAKLAEILKFVDTKLYIEVRPRYLLPDTNCFIDCLEDFERLVTEYTRYTLIIPLTVVKELDGLSKGVKLDMCQSFQKQRIHHFDDVSSRAKKSLEFIKTAKSNVKCASTKGSIINPSLFGLVEEEYVSNDDKILATGLSLSKTMNTETCKDGRCLIRTELVLITTDRNLRVKALSRNLAVSELNEFLQWAKNCSDI